MPEIFEANREKPKEIIEAEIGAGKFFDDYKTGKKRVSVILERVMSVLNSGIFDKEGIVRRLRECENIKERDVFVDRVVSALLPVIEMRAKDPRAFAKIANPEDVVEEETTNLTENFSYNEIIENGEKAYLIHLPVDSEKKEKLSVMLIGRLFKEGLEELARITDKNSEIKKIVATSALVKKYQRLLGRLGFTITGPISEELRKMHFANEAEREVWNSEISREDFLKKFLKEKKGDE